MRAVIINILARATRYNVVTDMGRLNCGPSPGLVVTDMGRLISVGPSPGLLMSLASNSRLFSALLVDTANPIVKS